MVQYERRKERLTFAGDTNSKEIELSDTGLKTLGEVTAGSIRCIYKVTSVQSLNAPGLAASSAFTATWTITDSTALNESHHLF